MKKILSVIAGFIAGYLVIMLIEYINHKMYPLPPGFDLSLADRETKGFFMEMMPAGAFMMLLLAYTLGSFSGGIVSFVISENIQQPLIVGGALTIGGIANMLMVPHPVWFAIVSLLVYLPFAFAGGKLCQMFKKNKNQVG